MLLWTVGAATAAEKKQIRIGTWGTEDASFFLAGAITRILNRDLPNVNATVFPSGTARNFVGFEKGDVELGWIQTEALFNAPLGEGGPPFKKGEMFKKGRVLLYLSPALQHFIVLDSSKIKKITDLKNVTGAVMSPASLMPAVIPMRYHGVKDDDLKIRYMLYGPQCDALKDGTLDVAFISTLVPSPAITQLAKEKKIRFIPFEKEKIEKAVKENPQYVMGTVLKDSYGKGVPETDYVSMGQLIIFGVSADLDEKLVSDITKAITKNVNEITQSHVEGKSFSADNTAYWIKNVKHQFPFHPGAKKALQEQGVKFVQ
jgi:hypothetical protein